MPDKPENEEIRRAEHANRVASRWEAARVARHAHEPHNSPSGPLRELVHAAGYALDDGSYHLSEGLLDAFDAELVRQQGAARSELLRVLRDRSGGPRLAATRRQIDIGNGTARVRGTL